MSVLIKGMEMPTTCGNCPVHKLWPEDDEAQCMIKKELWTKYSKRNPDCPLIEVPDGNGRLIDADALEENAQKRLLMCSKNDNQFQKPYEVMRAIALAPTVIPPDKDSEE